MKDYNKELLNGFKALKEINEITNEPMRKKK
jgi:hypothetical protein